MTRVSESEETITEVLHSPALYDGPLRVTEKRRRVQRRLWSGTYAKTRLMPVLSWAFNEAPRPIALWPVAAVMFVLRCLYVIPSNPIRQACEHLATIAGAAGHDYDARSLYRAFFANFRNLIRLVLRLYRDERHSVIDCIVVSDADAARLAELVERHGGLVLALPHNVGSTFSGAWFSKAFPAILVARNSASIERTRFALGFFERLGAKVLMVRGARPMRTSRTLVKALRSGKVVVFTVDLLSNPDEGIATKVFGQEVYFPAWSVRIPTSVGVPVVPTYVNSQGDRLVVTFGETIVSDDAAEVTRRIAEFLEKQILADPASWSFLAEKHWGKVLREAAAALPKDPV